MRHKGQVKQNRISPEPAGIKDFSPDHLDNKQSAVSDQFYKGKAQNPCRHLVLGMDHKENANSGLCRRHQKCQDDKQPVAVGHTLLRSPEIEGCRRPDHDQHGQHLDRCQRENPVKEIPKGKIDSRPCQTHGQCQSLQTGRINSPLLFKFHQSLGVYTIKKIQGHKNGDNAQPGIKRTVLTILIRRQQSRKNRSCDRRNALLQKRTDQKPEGSPHLHGHLPVFLQNISH